MRYITIKTPKCLLLVTPEEFKRMVKRGKFFKRAQKTAERQEKSPPYDMRGTILDEIRS